MDDPDGFLVWRRPAEVHRTARDEVLERRAREGGGLLVVGLVVHASTVLAGCRSPKVVEVSPDTERSTGRSAGRSAVRLVEIRDGQPEEVGA